MHVVPSVSINTMFKAMFPIKGTDCAFPPQVYFKAHQQCLDSGNVCWGAHYNSGSQGIFNYINTGTHTLVVKKQFPHKLSPMTFLLSPSVCSSAQPPLPFNVFFGGGQSKRISLYACNCSSRVSSLIFLLKCLKRALIEICALVYGESTH